MASGVFTTPNSIRFSANWFVALIEQAQTRDATLRLIEVITIVRIHQSGDGGALKHTGYSIQRTRCSGRSSGYRNRIRWCDWCGRRSLCFTLRGNLCFQLLQLLLQISDALIDVHGGRRRCLRR